MKSFKNKSILCCFGEGGHAEQMNRFAPFLKEEMPDYIFLSLSDVRKNPSWSDFHYITGELRGKYSYFSIFTNIGPLQIIKSLLDIKKHHNVCSVITTGPGIGLVSAIFFKINRKKIVHIETWSRFKTRSLTGKLMYRIADKFYVQHKSLLAVYPKAIYSGQL